MQSIHKDAFGIFRETVQHGNVSPDLQTMLYYSQKYVNESDFNYLKLLYCGAEGKNDDTLKKLENETRMPCMFRLHGKTG